MSTGGWHLVMIGLAWWIVLPLAAGVAWLLIALQAKELATLTPTARRSVRALRVLASSAVMLMLLEPSLTFDRTASEKPSVAVVVDTSGSMAANDAHMAAVHRLDEAIALGFIAAETRPDALRRAALELTRLEADLPAAIAVLAAPGDARHAAEANANRARMSATCAARAEAIGALVGGLAGNPEFADHVAAQRALQDRLAKAFGAADRAGDAALIEDSTALRDRSRAIQAKLLAAQAAADAALVAGADAGSPIADGLERLSRLSRCERARRIVRDALLPELSGAEVSVMALSDHADLALDPAKAPVPAGTTDFSDALSFLAREWPRGGKGHVGGVIVVSDGRQTSGADAVPAVRSLAARGARVATIAVGDPDPPRDAVVADLGGAAEVFKGETVRLDARIRITGYDQSDWDLVLSCDGAEVDRRTVRGTGAWQTERFEKSDAEAGLHTWQARLERSSVSASEVRAGGGLNRDVWTGVPGTAVRDLLVQPGFDQRPGESSILAAGEIRDDRENYGERLRGYVVPPVTGSYTFWISGDDGCELRLALGNDALEARTIATVPDYCDLHVWDRFESQRSRQIPLQAGRAYYIEALHKQGLGVGHVAIGWQLPDNKLERPIPASRLAPAAPAAPETPDAAGTHPAHAASEQPEASITNNQAECTIAVIDDPLKVLVVDATPRWESRYLVSMFERDHRVQVDRRYRSVRLPRGERELLPTTQAQLDLYDVVVLGDLTATEIPAEDQARLERFVSNRGGFVMCISGPRGMPASFGLGALANLLPVRAGTAATASPGPVTVALPDADAGLPENPITAVLDDPALNRTLWPALPALQWSIPGITAKPGAEILLNSTGALSGPIAAVCRYGAGRVIWLGSDETWRWRDRLGDRVHQAFWLQAVRWGVGSRLRGQDPRLQAAIDRLLVEPSGTVELRARARSSDGSPLPGAPRASLIAINDHGQPIQASEQTLALQPVVDADGIYHAAISGLPEGHWQVTVSSDDPLLAGLREVRELVVRHRGSAEGIELASDPANLAHLAAAGGFRSASLLDARALVHDLAQGLKPTLIPTRTTWSLWNGYGALIVVVSLLVCEWLWRKRSGLP